jgi:hypothetical protein
VISTGPLFALRATAWQAVIPGTDTRLYPRSARANPLREPERRVEALDVNAQRLAGGVSIPLLRGQILYFNILSRTRGGPRYGVGKMLKYKI